MDLAKRFTIIPALAFCLCVTITSHSQTVAQKPLSGTVSGRITIKGKGLAGVAVGLRRMENNGIYELTGRAISDEEGNYRISKVAAGSYDVSISAPLYVVSDQTQARKTIIVAAGENVEGLDFALVRGGVITGKITDADGRPVIQQQVSIYRADAWERRGGSDQPVFPDRTTSTDDRGIYRVFGLSAGRYKVAAGRSDDRFEGPQLAGRTSYGRVFHPEGTEPAKAATIEVSEGSEATNIDITLGRPIENYSVTGRVIDDKGAPVPAIRLALERITNESFQAFTNFTNANAQGEFIFDAVAPGKYYASMLSERGDLFLERVLFEVTDRDVSSLVLKLGKGASISGVVSLDTDDPKALAKLRSAEVSVFVSVATSAYGGRSVHSTIGADGSFRVTGIPSGIANVYLRGGPNDPSILKSFVLSRLERDGIIQPPRGLEIREAEQVTGIRAVFAYGDAILRGKIEVTNGTVPADARFLLRLIRPGQPSTQIGWAQTDSRGRFVMENLPAGTYELLVSPNFSQRFPIRNTKQMVTLTAGATTEITFTLDLSEPKSPQ